MYEPDSRLDITVAGVQVAGRQRVVSLEPATGHKADVHVCQAQATGVGPNNSSCCRASCGCTRPVRRALFWLGLNLPRTRPGKFGTFGLSSYSALGAQSLHPLSPITTTLNYGPVQDDGTVLVRIVYDHRALDGSTVARALAALDEVFNAELVQELRGEDGTQGVLERRTA